MNFCQFSQDLLPPFFSSFKPIWAHDKQTKVFSVSISSNAMQRKIYQKNYILLTLSFKNIKEEDNPTYFRLDIFLRQATYSCLFASETLFMNIVFIYYLLLAVCVVCWLRPSPLLRYKYRGQYISCEPFMNKKIYLNFHTCYCYEHKN